MMVTETFEYTDDLRWSAPHMESISTMGTSLYTIYKRTISIAIAMLNNQGLHSLLQWSRQLHTSTIAENGGGLPWKSRAYSWVMGWLKGWSYKLPAMSQQQPRVQAPKKVVCECKVTCHEMLLVAHFPPQHDMVIEWHTRDIPGFQGAGYCIWHHMAAATRICV